MASVRAARDASFTLFLLAFATFAVSYGSPYWYATPLRNEGLWQTCVKVGEIKDCAAIIKDNSDAWMKGVQAMMTMALFWQVFAFLAYIAWLRKDPESLRKRGMTFVGQMALVFNCLAGVSITCAVIPYGSMFDSRSASSLCWAFFLAVISGFLQRFVSAVALAAVGCQGPEGMPMSDFELRVQGST